MIELAGCVLEGASYAGSGGAASSSTGGQNIQQRVQSFLSGATGGSSQNRQHGRQPAHHGHVWPSAAESLFGELSPSCI